MRKPLPEVALRVRVILALTDEKNFPDKRPRLCRRPVLDNRIIAFADLDHLLHHLETVRQAGQFA